MIELPETLQASRIRLMLDHPYLASAITRFPMRECIDASTCPIMATDGYHILYNPAGLEKYDGACQRFILAHEVMHCLLGHIDRRKGRNPRLWNIAIDYATNLMLTEFGLEMPGDGLHDPRFKGETAEEIYEDLMRTNEQEDNAQPQRSFDCHLPPGSIAEGFRALGEMDCESPSTLERKRIRKVMTIDFREQVSRLHGTLPCNLDQEINQADGGRLPWETLLARLFSGLRRDDYRLFPPSKKHIWRGLYLPSLGRPGPSHIIVAVDTSGSMSEKILGKVLGEIDKLRSFSQCRLTLIQCDAKIHSVDEYDEYTQSDFRRYKFHGRGGTAFEPVFNWLNEQSSDPGFRPDVLFYMTDGYGSFPKKPPTLPVAWILTPQSHQEIPFGQKIMLN